MLFTELKKQFRNYEFSKDDGIWDRRCQIDFFLMFLFFSNLKQTLYIICRWSQLPQESTYNMSRIPIRILSILLIWDLSSHVEFSKSLYWSISKHFSNDLFPAKDFCSIFYSTIMRDVWSLCLSKSWLCKDHTLVISFHHDLIWHAWSGYFFCQ